MSTANSLSPSAASSSLPKPPSVLVITAGGIGSKASSQAKPSKIAKCDLVEVELLSFDPREGNDNGNTTTKVENKAPQPFLDSANIMATPSKAATSGHDVDTYSYKPAEEILQQQEHQHFLRSSSATPAAPSSPHRSSTSTHHMNKGTRDTIWLLICFLGIMASFVVYGLLLEYTTSGGRQLHELSFLFVTSVVYTLTAAAGRYVRDETPTTIPPARFAVLGLTSMGSTFCSVRSLRYVIYPIQVLAKSCKPVPVMLMGALMGKKYPLKKYINVLFIVLGVGLFTGGGDMSSKKKNAVADDDGKSSSASQIMGILLLFISLCFDGGTGAYEDKLMCVHKVGPFDLMYNIQLGKTILAGVSLLVLNQVHVFVQMCADMGFLLIALGLSGALGQVFIFVTISKFGALTCSIIGLARKVATLVASIYFYGHVLNKTQMFGLVVCIGSMVANFGGKKGGHGHGDSGHGHGEKALTPPTQYSDRQDSERREEDEMEGEEEQDEEKPLILGQGVGGDIEMKAR